MDEIGEFKEYVLYPAIFENPNAAFPEMEFKRSGRNWVSCYHLNGERNKQGTPVTYLYAKNPKGGPSFCLVEQGHGNCELVKFVEERRNTDFSGAIEYLKGVYGLNVPFFDTARAEAYRVQRDRMEEARSAFVRALGEDTEEAREVMDYLRSRNWTTEEIRSAGLGLVTSEILDGLKAQGEFRVKLKEKEVEIGKTHILAIPWRSGSRLLGFKVREVGAKTGTKYLNTKGLSVNEGLFGIGVGIEDVVVVEGELDALHAQVRGADNVAATAGGGLSPAQAADAVKRGAKRITLLLDNDERGQGFIPKSVEVAESFAQVEVYVAAFPGKCKDLDEYMGGHTVEEFGELVSRATPAYLWKARAIRDKYVDLEDRQGDLDHKQREDFLDEMGALLNSGPMLTRPYNRELVFNELKPLEGGLKFDLSDFHAYVDREYHRKRARARAGEIEASVANAKTALDKGDTDGALRIMADVVSSSQIQDRTGEFVKVFTPPTPEEAARIIGGITPGIPTGYTFGRGERLTLNAGLTFICGYRGHGKTSFLNNIALNEARRNVDRKTGKSVLYFSYEIDKRRLLADLLNTFANDPGISTHPSESIISSFKGAGDKYFVKACLPSDFPLPAGHFPGIKPERLTHYDYFKRERDKFFSDYIASGALIVVDENYKVEDLLEAIKFQISVRPVSIVCIDYAQLLYSKDFSRQRIEEIKKVVNDIKDYANKAGIPFVMAAQFNREVNSPVSVDTKNIGEAGDFERIADTCIGLYHLKELHPLTGKDTKKEEAAAVKLLDRLLNVTDKGDVVSKYSFPNGLERVDGKLFVRLMKRRYGDYPLDIILDWEGRTKYIRQNDPLGTDEASDFEEFEGLGGDIGDLPFGEGVCPED